jgi:arylsulfatase A-like enzyme
MVANRPNILLLTSDQHRGDCFGFEGRRVHTPHLVLLTQQGTRFAACITPNVVCMPARASILTGLLPLTHGTADNGIDLDPDIAEKGFAGTLSRNGYHTAFIGKAHFSSNHSAQPTGRCENLASSHRFGDDWHGPYMGFDHVELMQLGHNYWLPEHPPGGMHYERWYRGDGLGGLKDELYRQHLGRPVSAAQTHASALPTAWHNSSWVGDRGVEHLRARGRERRAGHTRPFCTWVSFADPHHPFDAPVPWSAMHRPQEVDLPVHRTRDFDSRPWWHRAAIDCVPQGPNSRVRQAYSRMPQQNDTQLRELIASYYAWFRWLTTT